MSTGTTINKSDKPAQGRLKRVLKKTVKYTLLTLLILIIALVSVPLIFKDEIKAKVLKEIDKNITADVNFTELSFSSFKNFPHLSVILHDVSVVGLDEFTGDTLASAKEVSVSLDLFSMLKGHSFEINNI